MKCRPLDSAVSFHVTRLSHRLRSGGCYLIACSAFRLMQASRHDPPYQCEWTVCISWIIVATALAGLDTGRSALPVSRDLRAVRRFSHSQLLFFGVPLELPYLSCERLLLLENNF